MSLFRTASSASILSLASSNPPSPSYSALGANSRRCKVVIIGGGFVGASVAHQLDRIKEIDLTLIDTKSFFEDTTGVLASMVDPTEHSPLSLQIPFSSFLNQTDIIIGEVINVTSRHVILSRFDTGDAAETVVCLPYNILIICSGMRSSFVNVHSISPKTVGSKTRLRTFVGFSNQLKQSKSIAVVGGRLVGTELAGRIAAFFQKKGNRGGDSHTVTLFEKEPDILPGFPEAAVSYTRKRLEDAGVKVLTSREALFPSDQPHSVSSGTLRVKNLAGAPSPLERKRKWGLGNKDDKNKAAAAAAAAASAQTSGDITGSPRDRKKKQPCDDFLFDLIIDCTGGKPNTGFLSEQFGDALDEHGFVKVRSTMQVHKHPFVFAAGDIISMMDERTSTVALTQASVVAKNAAVMALMGLQPSSSLGSMGKLRASFVPKQEPFIHYVAGVVNDKDGFVVESHSFSSASSKIGALKRKNDSNALKFAGKRKSVDLGTSSVDDSATPSDRVYPRYHFSSLRRSLVHDLDPSLSPKTPPGSPISPALAFTQDVAILRFCDSPLGKSIAYCMMKYSVPIHPYVRVDQIHEATALLRDAPQTVTVTAEMPDRGNFITLLCTAKCVIVPLWPSTDDDDMASSMVHECRAVASAVNSAHVPHVIVVCPKTRHPLNACAGTPVADTCMSCVFEECVQTFRDAIPKRLTIIYIEPEMRNPVLMQTLQDIQLNRLAPLPLGSPEDPEHPVLFASFVASEDVAEVVYNVFQNPQLYKEKEYHLTGTKAMSGVKIAHAISRSIGEDVCYQCVNPMETFNDLLMSRVPRSVARLFATCLGTPTPEGCISRDMKLLIGRGRRPLSFSRWTKQKRALFLSGTVLDDIDLDDVLKKPEAVRELIASVVTGKRIVHTEINEADLKLEEEIGHGACAVVYKAQYRGATVAVKQFKASVIEFEPQVFRQEVAIISILRHPDLVSCIGACTHNKESLRIVVEYMPQGSLDSFIRNSQPSGPFTLQRQLHFACDIARAMKFLHGIGLIHGDLKPANLLVTDNMQIKLTDFDTCKFLSPKMKTQLGTPVFIPPESFKEKGYTQMVDVYAYGITLWEIVTRKEPYADIDVLEIPDRVIDGMRPELEPSHPFNEMMTNCWHEKPHKRPTFVLILEQLEAIALSQGITLRQHVTFSSNTAGGFGSAQSSPKLRSKSNASSSSSPLIRSSSTGVKRTSSTSPPDPESPTSPLGKGAFLSKSPKTPPTVASSTSSSAIAPKRSAKSPIERRLVHRQSTPNMRGDISKPVIPNAPSRQKEAVTAGGSPESGSAGTNTPGVEMLPGDKPRLSQSVPSSMASSPTMDTSATASLEAILAEQSHASTIAESSHFRAPGSQYRLSASKELTIDASCGAAGDSTCAVSASGNQTQASAFLLLTADDDIVSEQTKPTRKKHHHKEGVCSSSGNPVRQPIRVKPPPITATSSVPSLLDAGDIPADDS